MNAAVLALVAIALFALGYRFYSGFLSRRIFDLRADELVPAKELEDGIDYVPTRLQILWGHHFTSIAGAAPIVGPALAVIWGWAPALIWVVGGTIAMGAVHDFSALVISLRNRGRSIGDITGEIIGPRARMLFLIVIAVLIWVVLAVFAFIIGTLFRSYPASIFPINVQILVAIGLGWLVYRRRVAILAPSLLAYAVLLVAVFFGDRFIEIFPAIAELSVGSWVWILLIYSFFASVLPVWLLLQPRDYLNSHQLVTGLVLLLGGLAVLQPTVQAPAFNPNPEGAPALLPFLFITIACGAISGFHGLVSSGTTSKQIECMTDARPIGYGGMLGEGILALLAVLATTAGFASYEEWVGHYASWSAASGLSPKLEAFVSGGATFVSALGIPAEIAQTFIAVMVIAFAATSLDTGARIMRLILAEIGETSGITLLANRHVAAAVGIGAALVLALTEGGGKGGLALWPLFGTTNQLVAGVTLLVVTAWLRNQGKPTLYTGIPCVFVALVTLVAMLGELSGHIQAGRVLLMLTAGLILVLDIWLLFEGARVLTRPVAKFDRSL